MKDWKKSTVYQIYPKSFCDSNHDGLGDLRGVIQKLDYICELGVDYIWLTPFFVSPQNDNGYDVADYRAVDPRYGTMEDLTELIAEADKRGVGVMLDMVFNHTSTEHEWFQRALRGEQKYQDYYIFRDGEPDTPPTNWVSKFGGNAWEYVPQLKKWYLHLFDRTQADLNWDNPQVREEMKEIVRFWKRKGVKGFRFDVVNLISKPEVLEDDREGDGRRFYADGPHVHDYLKELTADTGIADMITVGEMSSTSLEDCIRYSNPEEKELSMTFSFHHLKVDYKNGDKWELQDADFLELKRLLSTWQTEMQDKHGWNAVFWCNHDQPRVVSRFGDDTKYWKQSAKMLATSIHLLRGTPYIYQGEELGMTNARYTDIAQYRDVESLNYYEIMQENGKSADEALRVLHARSRDNGRTPMQWAHGPYAGFSDCEPWIALPGNDDTINAQTEQDDADSILNYYKKLVALRKQETAITEGDIVFTHMTHPQVFAFQRTLGHTSLLVFNNWSAQTVTLEKLPSDREKILGNYPDEAFDGGKLTLRPYESTVYRITTSE
ncbi:MAG: alpha,alpha-phosphotrehalase [Eubacteriales bacterium]|nr:alpha,alpha-phosphotrehalase [Eubacteriales bacterium]